MRRLSYSTLFILLFLLCSNTASAILPSSSNNPSTQSYSTEDSAYPLYSEVFDFNGSVATIDMDIAPDGSIYSLCRTGYYTGVPGENYLMVVKWTSEARYLWHAIWNTSEYVEANDLGVNDDGVFVTGRLPDLEADSVFLIKYSHSGQLLWERFWCEGEYQTGTMVNFDSEGSIYVGVVVLWEYPPRLTWNHSDILLKFDSEGSVVWYKTIATNEYYPSSVNVLISHDERLIVVTPYVARELVQDEWIDLWANADFIYTVPVEITPDGSFVAPRFAFPYGVSWINSTGGHEWYVEPPRYWDELIVSFLRLGGCDAAPDNSVYVLCALNINSETPTLVLTKYNSTGTQLWNRSLVYEYSISPDCIGDIETSNDGTVYIATTVYNETTSRYYTALTTYKIGEFTPYWSMNEEPTNDGTPLIVTQVLLVCILCVPIIVIYQLVRRSITGGWKN